VCFAVLTWLLAVSGGFLWLLSVTAAASMIMYISMCAALIQLRRREPNRDALRVPFGPTLAVIGILVSLVLIAQLSPGQLALIGVVVLFGVANWWFVREHPVAKEVHKQPDGVAGV
jgi:amino acid transporter